ncbi:MAG: glycosyltransferase family 9 protein, partial [Candidatus Rifleibacteriota bacterium]
KVKKPILIHPGHGGSAYNITPERYAEIARRLICEGFEVLISLGPGEEKLSGAFACCPEEKLDFLKNVPDFAILAAVMQLCRAFVGGSTGPMHLAAAVGLPVVAFFPPVPAMTPKRWGPVAQKNLVLMPSVDSCIGRCNQCKLMPCMSTIDLTQAHAWLVEVLKL